MKCLITSLTLATAFVTGVSADEFDDYRVELRKAQSEGRITEAEYTASVAKVPKLRPFDKLRTELATIHAAARQKGRAAALDLGETTFNHPTAGLMLLKSFSADADIVKPYTKFEYQGQTFELKELQGRHEKLSGAEAGAANACQSSPPIFNEATKKWEVRVENSLINFEVPTARGKVKVYSIGSTNHFKPDGVVTSAGKDLPTYPVQSRFSVLLRAEMDDGVILETRRPLELEANNLASWPPPAKTAYTSTNIVEFYRKDAPAGEPAALRIYPDTTVVTGVRVK